MRKLHQNVLFPRRMIWYHVKACFSIFRIRFLQGVQYRISALSGAAVSIFWALIEITVTRIFFSMATMRGWMGLETACPLPRWQATSGWANSWRSS